MLCDIYGSLLSDKQRDAVELYCNEDYSLSEIAENTGISRQGVRDQIKHAEGALVMFEEKLGLLKKTTLLSEKLSEMTKLEEVTNNAKLSGIISDIQDIFSLD